MKDDTVNLLKECNTGIKMGVSSINNVMPYVKNNELKNVLNACKDKHAVLGDKTHRALLNEKEDTKPPHKFAQVMADMKVKTVMSFSGKSSSVADVMTDGCNMGIKSIYRYLNKYKNASEEAKEIANDLISAEQELRTDLRAFL